MAGDVAVWRLGEARVTAINVGDLRMDLRAWIPVPEGERPARYAPLFREAGRCPVWCVHVALPGTAVLVDAGRYEAAPPDSPFALAGYQPPPDLLTQLEEHGARAEDIEHVVITHSHGDHYNGATRERGGRYEPCFPRARHYLGRADWEQGWLQEELRDPESLPSRTLGVLREQGLLELVEGDRELAGGVRIIAAPGESPGHQILRVQSQGQTAYCLGDLYHHSVEVERPGWTVHWSDLAVVASSRRALVAAALAEDALLIATHIHGAGRLCRTAEGLVWATVPPAI
jgi:glyoxylase-like metal-dependent hydrolase (beta-lactamase superfamily II)